MKPSAQIQAGRERPDSKKSALVLRCARLEVFLEHPADAQHEGEIDGEDRVVDRRKLEGDAAARGGG